MQKINLPEASECSSMLTCAAGNKKQIISDEELYGCAQLWAQSSINSSNFTICGLLSIVLISCDTLCLRNVWMISYRVTTKLLQDKVRDFDLYAVYHLPLFSWLFTVICFSISLMLTHLSALYDAVHHNLKRIWNRYRILFAHYVLQQKNNIKWE